MTRGGWVGFGGGGEKLVLALKGGEKSESQVEKDLGVPGGSAANKEDVDSLRVQKALAASWDQIDPHAQVHVLGTIEEAVMTARILAGGEPTAVLATGSLHLVGGLIEVLESETERTNTPVLSTK